MKKKYLFQFIQLLIIILPIEIIYAQEIITSESLGYSKSVKEVKSVDSLQGDLTIYRFNLEGQLVERKISSERYLLIETYEFEDKKIVVREKRFKNKVIDSKEMESFNYEKGLLVSRSFMSEDYGEVHGHKVKSEFFFFYNDTNLVRAVENISDGTVVTDKFFYCDNSNLISTKEIKRLNEHFLAKEYRYNDTIKISHYDLLTSDVKPNFIDYTIYDKRNNKIEVSIYDDNDELFLSKKNTYDENGNILSTIEIGGGRATEEYYYNTHGDVYKKIHGESISTYSYVYNNFGDPEIKKTYYKYKLRNIIKNTYIYWE